MVAIGVERGGAASGTAFVGLVTLAADFAAGFGSNLAPGLGAALAVGVGFATVAFAVDFSAGLAIGLLGRRAGLATGFVVVLLSIEFLDSALTSSSLFNASQLRTPRRRAISASSFFVRSASGPTVFIVEPLPHAFGRLWDGHTGIRAGLIRLPESSPVR